MEPGRDPLDGPSRGPDLGFRRNCGRSIGGARRNHMDWQPAFRPSARRPDHHPDLGRCPAPGGGFVGLPTRPPGRLPRSHEGSPLPVNSATVPVVAKVRTVEEVIGPPELPDHYFWGFPAKALSVL